ncbi:hypothetical protein VNO77_37619 [Canavalia gladiata]|uniref:Uncharacterized protein n=1 Tax=Canavalia gladiata TaxID=3824 RepID=A0AAN9K907_CANGL
MKIPAKLQNRRRPLNLDGSPSSTKMSGLRKMKCGEEAEGIEEKFLGNEDPLLMPDPEPFFSKCYKVPRAGKDRSSVTDKSNPIPKPTAWGLQPQLALDMT